MRRFSRIAAILLAVSMVAPGMAAAQDAPPPPPPLPDPPTPAPLPDPPKPPEPAPLPPLPKPPLPDPLPPLGSTMSDPLQVALTAVIEQKMPEANEEAKLWTLACAMIEFIVLTPEERTMVAQSGVNPTAEQRAALDAAHPGTWAKAETCLEGPDAQ